MEFEEVLLKRRSIRKYLPTKVNSDDINKLLHAAMSGPSACNKQPWEFYIVSSDAKLAQVRKASRFSDINAPVAIIVCGNKDRFLPEQIENYWIEDVSAAAENILLEATNLGLGSLWCGVYPQKNNMENVKKILNLPDNIIPFGILYIGYSDEEASPRDQYNEKFIHIEK